jgi:hypothetical protein
LFGTVFCYCVLKDIFTASINKIQKMKKNLFVALVLSMVLFSCAPRVVYVDRAATPPANNSTPPPSGNDNQVYQPPAGTAYTPPPANNTQQYNNNNSGQPIDNNQYNNGGQNNNGGQQQYYNNQNNNNQNNYQESDQQYYANQQQVNYGSSSYQTFYDELAPYGSWVNYQSYGYVWIPAQGPGFTPYATNGYWVYTEYGMTWVSNYNWGWAPFHYGNWLLDPFYGWLWIPGHIWAPAWVTWGHCNGYYGWAPIGPGVTYYEGYRPPVNHWCFVDERHVTEHNVNNYVVTHDNNYAVFNTNVTNVTIVNHDQTYNNIVYNAGPHREDVEKSSGHPIQTVNVSETAKPVPANQAHQNNNISIYRPAIAKATSTNAAPAHIVPIEKVKAINATAVHGSIPRQNVNTAPANHNPQGPQNTPATKPEKPAVRPIESSPTVNPNRGQAQPIQERPVPTQPIQERKPEPVQRNPNPNPNPNLNHGQAQPIQERPVPTQPIQERKPEPVQRNPNPTPNQNPNQNKPTPQPQPKPKPQPKPQPKPVIPKGQPEKRG